MSLKQIMGSAYNENLTLQEVEAFFEGNSKIVNLSNGGYVSKEKFDELKGKFDNLTENTKDYEDVKVKYQDLIAKQTKDGELAIINKYIQPDFAEFVHYQLKNGNKLGDKLEDNIKEYLKTNAQYGVVKEPTQKQNKVITTYQDVDNGGKTPQNQNQAINDFIRGSLNK